MHIFSSCRLWVLGRAWRSGANVARPAAEMMSCIARCLLRPAHRPHLLFFFFGYFCGDGFQMPATVA